MARLSNFFVINFFVFHNHRAGDPLLISAATAAMINGAGFRSWSTAS
jgi:hypothetical protein